MTGEIVAVAVRTELGARRTRRCRRQEAHRSHVDHLGHHRHLPGTGRQTATPLWAMTAFTPPDQITVQSPIPHDENSSATGPRPSPA